MYIRPGSYRRAAFSILFTSIVMLGPSASSAAQQIARSITSNDSPVVVVMNASVVTIESSKQKEVSIVAEVLASAIQADEVSIKSDTNKVEIACHPRRDRKVFVKLRVPWNAV